MKRAKFYIERRKDKEGNKITKNVAIRMMFSFDGSRLEYYTQQWITNSENFLPDYFKTGKQPVKANEPQAARINNILKVLSAKVELLYDNAIALGQTPTVKSIKDKLDEQFKGKIFTEPQKLVTEAYIEFLKETKAKKSLGYWKKMQTVYNHLKSCYTKKFDKLIFSNIDSAFVEQFRQYLIDQQYLNNTVVKYLQSFRAFLNWAKKDKQKFYLGNAEFENLKENDINVIALNREQIKHLENTVMSTATLERVKNVFLFGCYTGMRYIDIKKLNKEDVLEEEIRFYITKNREATWHYVPLIEQSQLILNKYKDLHGDKALPVLSNQKMNNHLKTIMQEAEFNSIQSIRTIKGDGTIEEKNFLFWQLISCHSSRKTFINLAVEKGIDDKDIKAVTGHSKNSRAFTKYYDVSPERMKNAMKKLFENT